MNIKELNKRKEASQARFKALLPPEDVMKHINAEADETYEINDGNLDKESFILGMMAMWVYCKKQGLMKDCVGG